jgi:hypothetical protein
MNRLVGILILLAAGLAIGSAWADTPPIVVGSSMATTTTTTPAPAPAPSPLASSASISVSSSRAGERPVALTLTLRYEMQCGYPGSGSLTVKLPAQEQLPASFSSASALLDGSRVAVAVAAGKQLRVELPARPHVMCDVIGPGKLTLAFTKAARLGNPAKAGTYSVSAQAGSRSFNATLRITA